MSIYRWLLRIAAPSLARDYGAAMEDMFGARLAGARTPAARASVWVRELCSLLGLTWSDRRRQRMLRQHKAGPMDTLGQEVQQAARRLWRSPAFTAATVLTLALAIGANTAIFAVVERVVWNPLPYPDSDRADRHGSRIGDAARGERHGPRRRGCIFCIATARNRSNPPRLSASAIGR